MPATVTYVIDNQVFAADLTVGNDSFSDPNAGAGLHAALIDGLPGDDLLKGFEGPDFLIGNSGDDTLTGGTGADTFGFKLEYHPATQVWVPEVNHTETFSLDHPAFNADWKAWEQYEHRLDAFFRGGASTAGSYEWYKANGYTFTNQAQLDQLETEWRATAASGPTTHLAGFDVNYLALTKNSGPSSDIPKNHDYDNNKLIAASEGKSATTYGFLYTNITATHTVVDTAGHYETTPEYFTSTDGNDQITDFKLADGDKIFLGVKNGALTESQFYADFTAVKDVDGHGVTLSLNGLAAGDPAQWSVHIKFDGVDPQGVNINGHDWASLTDAETETFVWQNVLQLTPNFAAGAITAGWDTYVSNWIAA